MTLRLPLALAATLMAATPVLADPMGLMGRTLGATPDEMSAALAAEGYEVLRVDTDDDEYEFDVIWNGERYEIEVSRASGEVREVSRDD